VGLQDVCLLFDEALGVVSEDAGQSACVELLKAWPRLARDYVDDPHHGITAQGLVDSLCDPRWPVPLGEDEAQMLQTLLQTRPAEELPFAAAQPTQSLHVGQPESFSDAFDGVATDVSRDAGSDTDEATSAPWSDSHANLAGDADAPARSCVAQKVDPELAQLLQSELIQITDSLAAAATRRSGDAATDREVAEALRQEAERLECFGNAAEAAGLAGFSQVARQGERNLRLLADRGETITSQEAQLLVAWSNHGLQYLNALGDPESSSALLADLCDARWPDPLPAAEWVELQSLLQAPVIAESNQVTAPRAKRADPQDVELRLPDDVDPELLEALLQELPSQTAELSAAVQRLLAGGAVTDVDAAQRIAHTVKGAANTVGVRGIATLTHNLEDILLAFSTQGAVPPRALGETLMNAADCLESMSEALTGLAAPPAQALEVLQQVLDWANRIDREGIPAEDALAPSPALAATPEPHLPTPAETVVATTPLLRVPAPMIDELLRLVGETIILTGQIHERLQRTIAETRAMREQFRLAHSLSSELEQLIDVRDLTKAGRSAGGDLDPLEFDQFNELHSCSRRLIEATEDSRESASVLEEHLGALDAMLVNQRRVNVESQEAVLQTRMVPVKNVLSRLERSVRQTCRATGRQVELHVAGSETLIDSDVLNDLVDPVMHLLRNAVDHGIEDEAGRHRRGKPVTGRIDLEFRRDGNQIVVRCADDGAGLDLAAIRHAGAARGVVSPDQVLSDEELSRLILRPNFSTRSRATHVSGRGIGLDAVYSRVLQLNGSLELNSEPDRGLIVELRLPITLISTHVLVVRAGGEVSALSNRGVEQMLHARSGEIRTMAGETTYSIGDEVYPARHLTALLGRTGAPESDEAGAPAVLLVRAETGITAVIVSEVVDSREIVVKGMGRYIPRIPGIAGATILGDGAVTPVIDLPELLRPMRMSSTQVAGENTAVLAEEPAPRCALIVDDSLSARRYLAQFVRDSGYEVRTARDGLEAVELIETSPPDLLLVDLEMPRMNGLELTHHVRARAQTRNLPVIMVTSRSTQKHRQMAQAAGVDAYLTKPFSEEELLGHMETARARHRCGEQVAAAEVG
jgi:chemosensory pili system protein ChpA (sensor histidine kinase/response regulator)